MEGSGDLKRQFVFILIILASLSVGLDSWSIPPEAVGAAGACEAPATITSDSVWGPLAPSGCSPYLVMQNVTIQPGVTLTIQPGTMVKFDKGKALALTVKGALVARGNTDNPITFTSSASIPGRGDWAGIKFDATSIAARYDTRGVYQTGSILQYATVEYADRAIQILNSSPLIDYNTIQNSLTGIYAYSVSDGEANPVISNNLVRSNTGGVLRAGGIVLDDLPASTPGQKPGTISASVSGNTISNNSSGQAGGIYASGVVTITGNTIHDNKGDATAGGLHLSGSGIVAGNMILKNSGSSAGGLMVAANLPTQIYGNKIGENTGSILAGGLHTSGAGSTTVTLNDIVANNGVTGGGVMAYGAATLLNNNIRNNMASLKGGGIWSSCSGAINQNNITDNTALLGLALFDALPCSGDVPLNARSNWWGKATVTEIALLIHDRVDDPSLGLVDFSSFLTSQTTTTPAPMTATPTAMTPASPQPTVTATRTPTGVNTSPPVTPTKTSTPPTPTTTGTVTTSTTTATPSATTVTVTPTTNTTTPTFTSTPTMTSTPILLPPQDVTITNIGSSGFTVSWVTSSAVSGYVLYGAGTTCANLTQRAEDSRGTTYTGVTHFVSLSGLDANSWYCFQPVSGVSGAFYTQRTTIVPSSPPFPGDPMYGYVYYNDVSILTRVQAQSPAPNALIYVQLSDADGKGTSGSSEWMATYTNSSGGWLISMANARTSLGELFSASTTGDIASVSAQAGVGLTGGIMVDTAVVTQGTATIFLDKSSQVTPTNTPTSIGTSPSGTSTPTLAPPTITPTVGSTSPTATINHPTPTPLGASSATPDPTSAPAPLPTSTPQIIIITLPTDTPQPYSGWAPRYSPPPQPAVTVTTIPTALSTATTVPTPSELTLSTQCLDGLDTVRLLGSPISPVNWYQGYLVIYYEKARLEDHSLETSVCPWSLQYGLLVEDLLSSGMSIPVGGDISTVTYLNAREQAGPDARLPVPEGFSGGWLEQHDGSVFIPFDSTLFASPGHTIPSRFWEYINRNDLLPGGWLHDIGLPMTEPMNAIVNKGEESRVITLQFFQRTVLTDDPQNPEDWQVERVNAGADYRRAFPEWVP